MELKEFFGPEGLIANHLPGYEYRLQQLEMAEAISQAFHDSAHLNPDSIYTNRYEHYIYRLCREKTVSFVSQFECLGYDATEGIYYRQGSKKLTTQEDIEILGIDEISIQKGHKDYVLVISDIGNKRVLEVLKDRHKESLDGYFDEMPAEIREKIKKVSIDMILLGYNRISEFAKDL